VFIRLRPIPQLLMRKLTHEEIVTRQGRKLQEPRLPFSIILNNIRSLYNVGSIFRTADGAGVEKIWLCGITGRPPNPRISKTALGAEEHVAWEYRDDSQTVIGDLKKRDYQIVILEQAAGSCLYEDFVPTPPVCLVIGNEIDGVSQSIIQLCDAAIEIEMAGLKNSLNVSVAFGIVAYHFRKNLRNR